MNKTIYNYHNDNILKNLCINFLYNLNKQKIELGLANIEINEKNKTIIFNEIIK
nr:MAG TPA: hypothetical protein [Caudoviricetes sp.]